MNTRDRVITALTPGSPFNSNGLIWRSMQALSQFAGCSPEETLELIAGDLADVAVVRPSAAGKGLLAALKEHVPKAANLGNVEVVAFVGGPAFNALPEAPPEPMEEAAELAEPPAHHAPHQNNMEGVCGVPDCGCDAAVGEDGPAPANVEAAYPEGMDPDAPSVD